MRCLDDEESSLGTMFCSHFQLIMPSVSLDSICFQSNGISSKSQSERSISLIGLEQDEERETKKEGRRRVSEERKMR